MRLADGGHAGSAVLPVREKRVGNNGLEEAAFHSRQFLSLVNKQNTRYN